jgi:hypothetical protein
MKNIIVAFLCIVFLSSCDKKDLTFKKLPEGPIKHHLIVLAKVKEGVKARGFLGATPGHTKIFCRVGKIENTVESNDDGSFLINLPALDNQIDHGEFTFTVDNKIIQQSYKIKVLTHRDENKDHVSALQQIAQEAFPTEKDIDSIDFIKDHAALLSSTGALISIFATDNYWKLGEKARHNIVLNQKNNVTSGAHMIAKFGNFIAATLFDTHEVVLIDPIKERVIDRVRLKNEKNQFYLFDVSPPLTVKNPIDADDSGNRSVTITKTTSRNAETVIALDQTHILASFVNYYQFADFDQKQEAVVGPGLVALLALENGMLITKDVLVLPYKNPRFFLKKDASNIWVSCSGVWSTCGSTCSTQGAGLVRVVVSSDFTSLSVNHKIPSHDFAIAEPSLVGDTLIIPHYWKNEIAVINEDATDIHDTDMKKLDLTPEPRFTFSIHWYGDIIFLGDARGTLIAYSLTDGFFPFPFIEPIVIDRTLSKEIPLNPLKLYFRHTVENLDLRVDYPQGYNAWILSASYKIYPLDFLSVFGP